MNEAVIAWDDEQRMKELCGKIVEVFQALMEKLKLFLNRIANSFSEWLRSIYPNRRVAYLADHAKTARARKKNTKRIYRWLMRACGRKT